MGEKEYAGTPEQWKLIVTATSHDKMFTNGDYNYSEIMHLTKTIKEKQ